MLQIISLSCVLLAFVPVCHGNAKGPPITTCTSMSPNHGVPAQNSSAPYTITTSAMSYQKGQNITVTISAIATEEYFKGFFIQARSSGSTNPVGQFYVDGSDSEIQLISCPEGTNNAVSHASSAEKKTKEFIWNNPNGGDVTFQATFVRVRITFWTNVRSEQLAETPVDTVTSTPRGVDSTTRNTVGPVGDNTTPNSGSCTTLSVWVLTAFAISVVFST